MCHLNIPGQQAQPAAGFAYLVGVDGSSVASAGCAAGELPRLASTIARHCRMSVAPSHGCASKAAIDSSSACRHVLSCQLTRVEACGLAAHPAQQWLVHQEMQVAVRLHTSLHRRGVPEDSLFAHLVRLLPLSSRLTSPAPHRPVVHQLPKQLPGGLTMACLALPAKVL